MTSQLVDALFREATYRHRRNEFEHAEDSYRRVLALQPDHPDALSLLPLTLLERQTKTEDAAWGNRAIRKNPLNSLARINYGHHLRATDQTDRAETQFIFAQVINPADHDGIYNEAVALAERGEIVIAISRYRRALSIHPGSLLSKSNLSLALLTVGEYTEGWELYETRFNYAEFTSWSNFDFGYPKWNADSSLRGRRVVLWSEQGLGDTLQFCRFASLLIAAGAQVKLVASSSLHRILLTLHTAIEVFEAPPKDQDYHFPLMSLPRALGVTANQIPVGDTP
jgi:tetratricopeptide (TPR) repeat protein